MGVLGEVVLSSLLIEEQPSIHRVHPILKRVLTRLKLKCFEKLAV